MSGESGGDDRARWDARWAEGDPFDPGRPSAVVRAADPWLPTDGWALDVACGTGRNTLHLAERGLRVVAVDLSGRALHRLGKRTAERDLPVHPVQADLGHFAVRPGRFRVIVNTRFLLRSAFSLIREALAPGGLLVFETYNVDEIELLGGDIRRAYTLGRGELRKAFEDFDALVYQEGVFPRPEGDRGLARLIARKPGPQG